MNLSQKEENRYLIKHLNHRQVGPYRLYSEIKPKRRSGHRDVDLYIEDETGRMSVTPIVCGLFSFGRYDHGILPWLDMHFRVQTRFENEEPFFLSQKESCEEKLFRTLGELIAEGGMIFVSYLTDITWDFISPIHELTRKVLNFRNPDIPPAATPLGRLLFFSGCRNIKGNVYDVQGSGRIAGEKSDNAAVEELFTENLDKRLNKYLSSPVLADHARIESICRQNARVILESLAPVRNR
ncbi:MAG: hypothetical protein JXB26_17675 [Candidatus Aminicenantes bacterium]|nr:hypothetical protein [Candidatus Aminicenantes bacterium]